MYTTEFEFLQTKKSSQIFLAHYLPPEETHTASKAEVVILVPPFAEEMNRSKRMYVLCARMLAQSGYHAICFDFSGTGDSSGEWGQFSYSDWLSDLTEVVSHARRDSCRVNFISLRFAALVLADTIKAGDIDAEKCVFWDPVESGEILMRQLVRMKIAAAMADDSKKISTQEVTDAIARDGYFESGGYHITQSMFEEIQQKKISTNIINILRQSEAHWMTLGNHRKCDREKWLPTSFKGEQISEHGLQNNLIMHPVNDVKFWMQQETTISPKLLQETIMVFANGE